MDASAHIALVDGVLADTISSARAEWGNVSPHLTPVFEEIGAMVLGGGKRLRPQFCHWGWVAADGDPADTAHAGYGAGIELLHVTALFHDDVIDDAHTRRNRRTTHRLFMDIHADNDWAGDARRFGEGAAILFGDITYVMSDSLMDGLNPAARAVWHALRLEMNVGQWLDTLGSARRDRDPVDAELVCRMKSAKYTIERPLHLGALAADPMLGAELQPMLSAYGLPLGDAFQMRDDMLGAFGDEAVTGKPVGGDFREGKPTPLLALAWSRADHAQRHVLESVGDPLLTAERIAAIQQVVTDTGAAAEMESRIGGLASQAIGALDASRMAGSSHAALVDLADVVTSRAV